MSIKNIINPLLQLKFILRKRVTVRIPYEKKKPSQIYRGSHYNDIDKCIGCGNCSTICMNNAIDMIEVENVKDKEQDSGLRPRVDYGRCCFCGLCVDICPSSSLVFSNEYLQIETSPDKFIYTPGIEKKHLKYSKSYTQDISAYLQTPKRVKMTHLDPNKRIKSFAEEVLGYSTEEARKEAQRCMECGICVVGCPDNMHIPEYIRDIGDGNDMLSVKTMLDNNPMPEICGKVCTRHCEDMCVAGINGEPLAIRWLKRYASERLFEFIDEMEIEQKPDNGKSIAIIGAGPSGITAAYYLRLMGYSVNIFEEFDRLGGMAFIGIPRYRLPMDTIERQKALLDRIGVKFSFNTKIGKDIDFDTLRNDYNAVFMGIGMHRSRKLNVNGEDLPGVLNAMDFLKNINLGNKIEVGKKVIVIGGGNVAIDSARVCRRLGAEVDIYYRRREIDMPADNEEIIAAQEEGINIIPQRIPLKFEYTKSEKSLKYYCAPAKMVDDENGGRPKPVLIEDELFCLENIDTIIVAIGQSAESGFVKHTKIFNDRGKIVINENGMTEENGVFAGGDTVNSKNDLISAIADGVKAARGIDEYLRKDVAGN